jgi:hypothetical protein
MKPPLAIDLCHGKGGWTRGLLDSGFRVIGFDIARFPEYPGQSVLQDVRTLHGLQLRCAALIVASPPCQEFSRHDMPWTRARNPPPPDLSIVEAIWRIRKESGVPTIIENTRGSRKFLEQIIGQARRVGSFFLYGDVPALLPKMYPAPCAGISDRELARKRHCRYSPKGGTPSLRPGEHASKERMPHNAADRAVIPYELARWIGEVYYPHPRGKAVQ